MSDRVVFAGPSLTSEDQAGYPAIRFLPPVAAGDLFALSSQTLEAVGIIDGFFGDRRALGHKEILWCMARGCRVFGGASLGALRAAELDVFGMVGVGEIYRGYRSGRYRDDADVAVIHGPAHVMHRPLSVAFVDVLATLDALVGRELISLREADSLTKAARETFFADMSWERIVDVAMPHEGARAMARLLASAHVERKRLDALELLHRLATDQDIPGSGSQFDPPSTITLRRDLRRAGLDPDIDDRKSF